MMSYASNTFVAVFQVLDDTLTAPIAPPGARATIHGIIDDLRRVGAQPDLVAQTEEISVQLHRLEGAVARSIVESPLRCMSEHCDQTRFTSRFRYRTRRRREMFLQLLLLLPSVAGRARSSDGWQSLPPP